MTLGLVAASAAAVCYGYASILQARAATVAGAAAGVDPRLLARLATQLPFLASLLLDGFAFALHVVALRSLPLFVAQAVLACSVAVTALLSVRLLGARLRPPEWVAVAGVCLGLVVLAVSAGPEGHQAVRRSFDWFLLGAVALPLGAGMVAARVPGWAAPVLLGAAAGLAFSIVGVAARLLPGWAPAALLTDPASYALLLAGPGGFLLYATALQRGSVTAATAPVVVMETLVPALVGVLLLGDRARGGGALPAALGLTLVVAGCVTLARFGEAPAATAAGPAARPARW